MSSDINHNQSKKTLSKWKKDVHKPTKKDLSKDKAIKQSSYDQYVKQILTDSKSALHQQDKNKARMRKILFPKFRHYFEIMSFVIVIFLFSSYNMYVKCALIGGFFANLIGLMVVIFKYAFSSSDNYYKLIRGLLKWAYEEHKINNK